MNYILSETNCEVKNKYKVCAFIHLYYDDSVYKYEHYIKNIPNQIDIVITYSNDTIFNDIKKLVSEIDNKCFLIKKENRGRDISAILVAGKDKLLEYDIVCFIHDKKSRDAILEQDTEAWIYSMWENTLSSKEYIENIISIFEREDEVGVLTPPLYLGNYFSSEYINQWGNDYEILIKLLRDTGVNILPTQDSLIRAYGTVFWARTDALKKLFSKKWVYEDFGDEPLPIDGTISHAIERSICFYAEDAGYKCHTVMTLKYADERMTQMQNALISSLDVVAKNLGCKNLNEIESFEEQKENLKTFCFRHRKICIYGAGVYGRDCKKILNIIGVSPIAFIVSSKEKNMDVVENVPVVDLSNYELDDNIGIIVAVSKTYRSQVLEILKNENRIKDNNLYIYKHIS